MSDIIRRCLARIAVVGSHILVIGLLLVGGRAVAQEPGWSEPMMLSTNTVSSWFSDIAVDPWGGAHVVWNSGLEDGEAIDLLMYSGLLEGAEEWSTANDVIVTGKGGYTIRPAIATGLDGRLYATYRSETTVYMSHAPVGQASNAVYWSAPQRISGVGAGSAYYSDVVVDSQGRIHVVWNETVISEPEGVWLWIGTSGGVALYDGEDWRVGAGRAGGLVRRVRFAAEDRSGVQWFGTADGAYSYDGVTWRHFTVEDGLIDPVVNGVVQDIDGAIWFGTAGGVTVYDEAEASWQSFSVEEGLPGADVRALAVDQQGYVWAGTEAGLGRYNGREWVDVSLEGGPAAPVSAIVRGREGVLWAATDLGVARYDGREWALYTLDQGLPTDKATSVVVDQKGEVWAGTEAGVARFDGEWWTPLSPEGVELGEVSALRAADPGLWLVSDAGVFSTDGETWEKLELPAAWAQRDVTALAMDRTINAMCPGCPDIFYRYSDNGGETWSAPINLSKSFAGSVKPQVQVSADGRVIVSWEEGEDWYLQSGYPVASMLAVSTDRGETWSEGLSLGTDAGVTQQPVVGIGGQGDLVALWRVPEENVFQYQTSVDNGETWSAPQALPGVVAKEWMRFSLDRYDVATDSAGRIHFLVLGRLNALQADLGVIHLIWDGEGWQAPEQIFASSDPPEWPRIEVGAGNRICATWFTRDERHIFDSERGRYQVWASCTEAATPAERATPPPTPTPEQPVGPIQTETPPTPSPTPAAIPPDSGIPAGLRGEADELARVAIALSPTALVLLVVAVARLGWLRWRR